MVGGTILVFHRVVIQRESSSILAPQPLSQKHKKAVLAHRSEFVSLDKAFVLIDGHPRLCPATFGHPPIISMNDFRHQPFALKACPTGGS